ncbi:MAG: hypothetical protein ACRD21_19005 [Vicinamibacteria bacterium]
MTEIRRPRWLKWLPIALGAIVLASVLVPLAAFYRYRSKAREKAIEALEERFDQVRLEDLQLKLLPGPLVFPRIAAFGRDLSISLPERGEDVPPFLSTSEFEVEMSLLGLLRDPIRIERLRLEGLEIQIPPKREGDSKGPRTAPETPFLVEDLVADGAVLRILPKNPEKTPLQYDMHELRVQSAGLGEPMRFDTTLENAKPPGQIQSEGYFGPLELYDAGASPVSGEYIFERADLSVFGGIAGTLYSEGRYAGVLERIEVDGFTRTPDFQLESAGNPVDLRTDFHAIVDGTNGDTLLQPVDALLGSSGFQARGGVAQQPGTKGKTVCVDAEGDQGRIEDFLRLAMKSEEPFMVGEIRFRSIVLIPPGDVDVAQKLFLDGEFMIDSASFPEPKVQNKIEELSEAAQGKNSEEEAVSALRDERVFSDMRGSFRLENGAMYLSYLSFRVPGADVWLEGTYGLLDQQIDLRGELRLDANVSELTSGVKSFFLKLVDPLFERKDAGAVIPIRIGGAPDKPSFGVELGRVFSREEVARPNAAAAEGGQWTKNIPTCSGIFEAQAE